MVEKLKVKKITFDGEKGIGTGELYLEGCRVTICVKGSLKIEFESGEVVKVPVKVIAVGDDLKEGYANVVFEIKK